MTAKPSPELELTIACCRWPRSPERDAAVRAAAASVADWDAFERLLSRHRVTPLVHDGLTAAGVSVPAALAERLNVRAAQCAVKALSMAQESVRLQRAFDSAGLPALILKGTTIGVLAYGDPCLKESFDIDVLIAREDVGDALGVLKELGYELFLPRELTRAEFMSFASHTVEATFLDRQSGLAVDLHWGIDRNPHLLPGVTVHSPSQLVPIGGAVLRTFSDELTFVYLCTHGTKHGWARLKWLADLGGFMASDGEGRVERLHEAALRAGAGRASGASLLLCRQLLGTALPESLFHRLKRDRSVRQIEAISMHYIGAPLAADDIDAPTPVRLFLLQLMLAPGHRYFLAQLRVWWIHPSERAQFARWFHVLRLPLWFARRIKGLGTLGRRSS